MGNSSSNAGVCYSPNVKERHSRAFYINIPIAMEHKESLMKLTMEPCILDTHGGKYWLSILVDDLDILQSYILGGFVSTGMLGWMCKFNLLVRCPVTLPNNQPDHKEEVSGYQIMTLDFENNYSGYVKVLGSRATQCVPTFHTQFNVLIGDKEITSGYSIDTSLESGTIISAKMSSTSTLSIKGTYDNSVKDTVLLDLYKFITNRPHKFLVQYGDDSDKSVNKTLMYSPEIGEGAEYPFENCVPVVVQPENLDIKQVLVRIADIIPDIHTIVDPSQIVCFVQPSYTLVDHHNTKLSTA